MALRDTLTGLVFFLASAGMLVGSVKTTLGLYEKTKVMEQRTQQMESGQTTNFQDYAIKIEEINDSVGGGAVIFASSVIPFAYGLAYVRRKAKQTPATSSNATYTTN